MRAVALVRRNRALRFGGALLSGCALLVAGCGAPRGAGSASDAVTHAPVAHDSAPMNADAGAAEVERTATPADAPASEWATLSPSIRINRAQSMVEFVATSVITTGFLEEYVCTAGTREHESLFAFDGKASEIHAAMLLAGFVPGAPGQWREAANEDGSFRVEGTPPRGDRVTVEVQLGDGRVLPLEHFVRASPVGDAPADAVPPREFVFAGSRFRTDRKTGVERYLADGSGSLIGLVTFGDETVGPTEVLPDQASAASPIWEVFTERMPEPGTKVMIRLSGRPSEPAGREGAAGAEKAGEKK